IAEQSAALYQCSAKLDMVSLVAKLYDQVLHAAEQETTPIDYQRSIFQQIFDYITNNYMLPDYFPHRPGYHHQDPRSRNRSLSHHNK
ncbi:MAG: hypothetical protein IJ315_06510, partial [Firmicutes bacterium]|nr:hypothetical protein [Bacillota bacterium]